MPEMNELSPGPPGSVLQDARINAGKSVVDVAVALNLLKTYVEALEENDYSRFNSPLFARGYIKSYARYMGLDEASLLRDCDRICRRRDEVQSAAAQRRRGAKAPARGGVAVALIAAVLLWSLSCWVFGDRVSEGAAMSPEAVEAAQGLVQPLLGSDALTLIVPGKIAPHTATVSLTIKERVWLELRDANNQVQVSGIQPQGKQLSIAIKGPVSLSVAYWPALTLSYNGQPVQLHALADASAEGKGAQPQAGEI